MLTRWTNRLAGAGVALLSLLAASCASSGDYMVEARAPLSIAAPADSAVVVFVRPSRMATAIRTTILDTKGRFLGELPKRSHFAVKLPPGEHVFLAWAENTSAVRATLAAGKTYYVRVAPRMGAWSARMQLFALTPKSEDWRKLKEWIAETQPLDPKATAGQTYLDGRREDVEKRIRRANEILKEYSPEELAERTIQPEDGE